MILIDFLADPVLNNLRNEMGAPLVDWDAHIQWDGLSEDIWKKLKNEGLDLALNEIDFDSDGAFAFKGRKVLVYIRDQKTWKGRESEYRFHITDCKTIQDFQEKGTYDLRYVVSNRTDGIFIINIEFDWGIEENAERELHICKNCLKKLSYKDYKYSSLEKKNEIFNEFSLEDYLATNQTNVTATKYRTRTAPFSFDIHKVVRGARKNQIGRIDKVLNNYSGFTDDVKAGVLWNAGMELGDIAERLGIGTEQSKSLIKDFTDGEHLATDPKNLDLIRSRVKHHIEKFGFTQKNKNLNLAGVSIKDDNLQLEYIEDQQSTPESLTEAVEQSMETVQAGFKAIRQGESGWSYESLFAPWLKGSKKITLVDPYIRVNHQFRNLYEFCIMLNKLNSSTNPVELELITYNDSDFMEFSKSRLERAKQDFMNDLGIKFDYRMEYEHDRTITSDNGWLIILGRGLDIFMPPDPETNESPSQEVRKCKGFTVSYTRVENQLR